MKEILTSIKRINPVNIETRDRQNVKTGVRFRIPYCLLLDPNKIYSIKHPKNFSKTHSIRVLSRHHRKAEEILEWFGLELEPELSKEIKDQIVYNQIGDRFGITGYCYIEIILDRYYDLFIYEEEKIHEACYKILEDACDIYNYFLDRYSAIVRHRQVSKINPLDIHQFDAFHLKDGKKLGALVVSTLHHAVFFDSDQLICPSEEVSQRLQEMLLLTAQDGNIATFGVSAVRHIFSGNYLSGIVEAVTQLEGFLHTIFRQAYLTKGVEEKKVDEILNSFSLRRLLDSLPLILNDHQLLELHKHNVSLIDEAINIRNKYVHLGRNIAQITRFEDADKYVTEINEFCVTLSRIAQIDNMLDDAKSGWK